ncbi:YkgJ family cysteine cluster protein [Sinorhizobium meliloti]|uniref:YkgJ family cysteine cluster protein n=1 Tax=Rhizobium meliloti TaxID=382 RepID=UPI001297C593|nr:YkgJ family cysteine cluster protein [Sinorhizobium meliloti]MQX65258.1 YkgJ family cysteine cluster protein [Sinorhizobium meliloti]
MSQSVPAHQNFDCQSCGACCAYSADWPRFSLETEEELERIPADYVAADLDGMRCESGRCTALEGKLGRSVACKVYDIRPIVCRTCMPGDDECLMAREQLFGAAC